MAYQPTQTDLTSVTGAVIVLTASGALTLGRAHEIKGTAAVTLTVPTATANGTTVTVKVDEAYTGAGVTMPSGMQQVGVLQPGWAYQWKWDGSQWSIS